MRTGITINVTATDRERLLAIRANRNSPQKRVWRTNIILLTADGCGTAEIMRRAGVAKTAVWRWQELFMLAGVDGLLRDKTRPPRIPPLSPEVAERVVMLTLASPPGETTHWTAAAMAAQAGISVSSVQRIWRAHGLQPHRMRQFKLSTDPQFAAKLRDIVGLYVDPPAHAVVLSVDEKSQIQALDRTQPGLPVLTFVDTSGAFPGIDAEARGQAEAIARSIEACLEAPVPVVATIIGEGGSGGAIALAAGDAVLMLEHAIYSVISPEGCAAILWKDSAQAPAAAEALKLTAEDLKRLGLIDAIVAEPLGGAHRDATAAVAAVGDAVAAALTPLLALDSAALKARRREKYLEMGREALA